MKKYLPWISWRHGAWVLATLRPKDPTAISNCASWRARALRRFA
jgi:hypothetical protein